MFRGCVSEVVVPTYAVGSICSPENLGLFYLLLCSRMMRANNRLHYGPIVIFVCLYIAPPHYHYHSDVSKGMELLLVRYSLSSVYLELSRFSQLSFMQYMSLCVFSLPISLVCDYENMYALCNYHHQVWNIWHSLRLGHETMVCAVCLSMLS